MSRIRKHVGVVGQRPRCRLVRAVLGEQDEKGQCRQQRHDGQAEHGVPAPNLRQPRPEERGQGGAAVARPRRSPWPAPDTGAGTSGSPAAARRRSWPRPRPAAGRPARSLPKLSAQSQPRSSGSIVEAMPRMPVRLAPMWSVSRPRTRRSNAPPSSGTATIRPFCESDRPNSGTIEFASAPGRIQTMKLTSKYRNALSKVGEWPARRKSRKSISSGLRGRGGGKRIRRRERHSGWRRHSSTG